MDSVQGSAAIPAAPAVVPADLLEGYQQLLLGSVDVLPADMLLRQLIQARSEGRALRVKLGVDPTAPDIHLGHTVVLRKLRQFQDLGHQAVLIIGDYTGKVGDPSGRSKSRPRLSDKELEENARTYVDQAGKVLDMDRVELTHNGDWLGPLRMDEVLRLTATVTVARMLERDDFSNRYAANEPISMLEFMYPLLQGYDSVAVRADIELGGTDQKFNLLMGRTIMEAYGLPPQSILTVPLLVGTDGEQKMSKSYGNYVGVSDCPADMFGKLMSIPDELMVTYMSLVTRCRRSPGRGLPEGTGRWRLPPGPGQAGSGGASRQPLSRRRSGFGRPYRVRPRLQGKGPARGHPGDSAPLRRPAGRASVAAPAAHRNGSSLLQWRGPPADRAGRGPSGRQGGKRPGRGVRAGGAGRSSSPGGQAEVSAPSIGA